MKYWKEKENNPVENMQFWTGTYITKLAENEIFLYGSNPQGINGAGAAKAAMSLSKGAKHGVGRGFNGSNAYALVTKSLNAGFLEKSTGILYDKEGYCSVSPEQIRTNIDELYEIARSPEHKDKKFLVSYQYESWPNGTPKKSLNGYTSQEMLEMFVKDKEVPPNIVFHESYKPHLEKLYKNQNKQSTGELVVYEDGKTVDIKEEDMVWTIDSDERNPQARHFAGAARDALSFGAVPINIKQKKPGIARGLSPNNKTYALITKSLEAGYTEPETGITYDKEGFQSVSPEQIRANVYELYETAQKPEHLDKKFLITYKYESWPNGTPKKSLNGYTSQEMLEMFAKDKDVPPNIIFHESYKPHLEKLYKNKNKQSNAELVVYEDGKTFDIKEEDIVWTTDSDERNPQGINGAGAAKAAMSLSKGAKHGVGRGFNGSNAYALVTKSLNAGFLEKSTGILYDKEGYCSVSPEQIRSNIDELYETAKSPEHKDKKFLVSYQYESWPNGTPKKSLNGYTSQEILEMFAKDKDVPPNIVFHESYKPHLEKLYKHRNQLNQKEQQEMNIGNKPKEYTYFFHLTSPFSNFHPARFEYRGLTFISNEQFMMYSKAKTFKDEETANRILNIYNEFQIEPGVFKDMAQKNCFQLAGAFKNGQITRDKILNDKAAIDTWNMIHKKIKQLGREVKNYDDKVWDERRFNVVLFGAREKFSQNEDLRNTLMKTGDTIMIEASPYDKLSTMSPNIQNSKEEALMLPILQKLKEEFLAESKAQNKIKP